MEFTKSESQIFTHNNFPNSLYSISLILILTLLCGISKVAEAQGVVTGRLRPMEGQSFVSTARYSQPLTGHAICLGPNPATSEWFRSSQTGEWYQMSQYGERFKVYISGNWYRMSTASEWLPISPGQMAFISAVDAAMNECQMLFHSGCRVASAKYKDFISTEFVGYKACEATVVVHGYRLANSGE